MPMSRHRKELRERVGDMLIVQPGVAAMVRDDEGRVLLQLRLAGAERDLYPVE